MPSSSTSSPRLVRRTPGRQSASARSATGSPGRPASPESSRSRLVRLADARTTHPAISATFAAGRLTVDQAAVAVNVAPHHDARIAEMAPLATVNQLHTMVRCSRPAAPAVAPPADEPADSVSAWTSRRWPLPPPSRPRRRPRSRRRWCARSGPRPAARRVRHHGDVGRCAGRHRQALDGGRIAGPLRALPRLHVPRPRRRGPNAVAGRDDIPDVIRDHLTCDGLLTPVFTEDAKPVSVGRTRRIVPEHTRRLVLLRDRACRVPWCGARRHLEVHHLDHWNRDGRTDYERLIALCSRCHRAHHHGLLGISRRPAPAGWADLHRPSRPCALRPTTRGAAGRSSF